MSIGEWFALSGGLTVLVAGLASQLPRWRPRQRPSRWTLAMMVGSVVMMVGGGVAIGISVMATASYLTALGFTLWMVASLRGDVVR